MNGKQKLPNIVLVVLDTVGAAHMSVYGYPRRTTPNLERIAGKCTVYNRCYAPGCWTIPSHASMFTGLYPSQHGAHEANLSLSGNYQHLVSVLNQRRRPWDRYATYQTPLFLRKRLAMTC